MLTIIPCSSFILPSSSSSFSSFHPPSSSALFLWLNNNRRSSSFTKKIGRRRRLPFSLTSLLAATSSQSPGGGKGKLYNDNELLEVLLLHQSITSTTNSTTNGNDAAARVVDVTDDDDYYLNIIKKEEEEPPSATASPLIGGGIHDWILQALENDGGINNDYYSNVNDNNNSDFDYTNDGSENNSIIVNDDTEEEEASPLIMSTAIHDWILHAIENDSPSITSFDVIIDAPVDDEKEKENEDEVLSSSMNASNNRLVVTNNENDNNNHNNIQMLLQNRKPYIRAIATDVDGTLLYGTYMHPITRDAIRKCISLAYNNNNNNNGGDNNGDSSKRYFFVATGKSRAGAMTSLGPEIGSLIRNNPGVYCQGLYCIDDQGNIIFERKLQYSAIVATEALAAQFGISIVAYDGDNLYTTNCTDSVIALSEVYGEPRVKLLLSNNESSASSSSTTIPMYNLAEYKPGIHKILLLDDDLVKLGHVRTQLEILALLHNATVTQAIPTMLELLPAGCSKAYGVEQVCLALGINPKTELLAIGDAENDVGMLNMASIGVAVGNASPQARNAADCIMKERVDEGGAGLAMNLFGFC